MNTQAFNERNGQRVVQEGMEHFCPSLLATPENCGLARGGRDASLEGSLYSASRRTSSATAYNLSFIPWDVFGTLTFGSSFLRWDSMDARDKRKSLFFRFLFQTARASGLRSKNLLAFVRTEFGESDKAHFHFLISFGGRNSGPVDEFVRAGKELWTHPSLWRDEFGSRRNKWQAKIEPFRAAEAREGIAYVTKNENDRHGTPRVPEEFFSDRLKREVRKRNAQAAGEFQFAC